MMIIYIYIYYVIMYIYILYISIYEELHEPMMHGTMCQVEGGIDNC